MSFTLHHRLRHPVARRAAAAAALSIAALVAVPHVAGANTQTLFVSASGSDASNGCTLSSDPCATVSHAIADAASGDVIDVAGTITDTVAVTFDLTIQQWPTNDQAVLEPATSASIVTVSGGTVTLSGLEFTDADATGSGGALSVGADATVVATNDTFEDNQAGDSGGAINNAGSLTVENSTIESNSAAEFGGGVANSGTLTIESSTIAANASDSNGGGVWNGVGATATVEDSTVADNDAGDGTSGGGLYNNGAAVVLDSTFTEDSAQVGGGGGGAIMDDYDAISLTIVASDVVGNTTTDDSGGGGIYSAASTAIHLAATVIADNTTNDCAGSGSFVSAGYNETVTGSGLACGLTAATDVVGPDPMLGALADNGGLTATLLPTPSSALVGAIPSGTTLLSYPICPGTDQRGVLRPQPQGGTACTIGAVEVAPFSAPAFSTPDSVSFPVGTANSFQVMADGFPSPGFTESGTLPTGVTFSSTGLLSGTPTETGTYPFTVTASNSISPNATEDFTLTVVSEAAITSRPETTWTAGILNHFQITSTGYPTATYSLIGAPTWLSINATTGVMSGTPPARIGGSLGLVIIADNTASQAVQLFDLTLDVPPAFTSSKSVTVAAGAKVSLTLSANGYPQPTITESGALPKGLHFSAKAHAGAAVVSGTVATADAHHVYKVKLQAINGTNPVAKQTLTITVS